MQTTDQLIEFARIRKQLFQTSTESENPEVVRALAVTSALNDTIAENCITSPVCMESDSPRFYNPVQSRSEFSECLSSLCQNDAYSPVNQNVAPHAFAMSGISVPGITNDMPPMDYSQSDVDRTALTYSRNYVSKMLGTETEAQTYADIAALHPTRIENDEIDNNQQLPSNAGSPGTEIITNKFSISSLQISIPQTEDPEISHESKPESQEQDEQSRKWECARDKPVVPSGCKCKKTRCLKL